MRKVLIGFFVGLFAIGVTAQGPTPAQIQQALRAFVQTPNTWTALQTFTGGITVSSCTGCGGGGGGAPTDATYITQVASSGLTNEQALSALSTGLMRVATSTGVVSSITNSAGLAANISDETGTGALVFATSPTLVTPALGTPSALNLANATNLPVASLVGQVALAKGGTGANLTDPGDDRILFWDDSAGAVTWLTAGTGLSIAGTTLSATAVETPPGGATGSVQFNNGGVFGGIGDWTDPTLTLPSTRITTPGKIIDGSPTYLSIETTDGGETVPNAWVITNDGTDPPNQAGYATMLSDGILTIAVGHTTDDVEQYMSMDFDSAAQSITMHGLGAMSSLYVADGADFNTARFSHTLTAQGDVIFDGTYGVVLTYATPTSGVPTAAQYERLFQNSLPSGNVLALQNTDDTGCSAITARDWDDGNEVFAVGHCSDNNPVTILQDTNIIESWSGTSSAGNPKRFAIFMDGNYGSTGSGLRFYQRQSFEPAGDMKFWKLIPSTSTQVEALTIKGDGTGLCISCNTMPNANAKLAMVGDGVGADLYATAYGTFPGLRLQSAAGSLASPTATISATNLGSFAFSGYTGSAFAEVASISVLSQDAYSGGTALGSRMGFAIIPVGATSQSSRFSITQAGITTVGATPTVANVGASSCGTTTATIAGNQNAGRVTVGATAGTQCRVAVPSANLAGTAWEGSCTNRSTANLCRLVGVDSTHFDLLGTFVAADVISYVAVAR